MAPHLVKQKTQVNNRGAGLGADGDIDVDDPFSALGKEGFVVRGVGIVDFRQYFPAALIVAQKFLVKIESLSDAD